MENFDTDCYNSGEYFDDYTITFNGPNDVSISEFKNKKYVFDLIKSIGHKDTDDDNYPDPSFLYSLNLEYSNVAKTTDKYIDMSESSFKDILKDKTDNVIKALNKAQDTLNKLRKPFDKINNNIGDKVSDYSKIIDDKGKLGVKLVFGVLMLMNVAIGIFMIFIGLCSMKSCKECCFCPGGDCPCRGRGRAEPAGSPSGCGNKNERCRPRPRRGCGRCGYLRGKPGAGNAGEACPRRL